MLYVYQRLISIHPFYHMILHDDNNLCREDYPLNVKRGDVCIYYRISLPLKIKNIHYLQECISFEIKIKDKLNHPVIPLT